VFPGWIGFSGWIEKESGSYRKREVLAKLARMDGAEREEDAVFGVYLWEAKKRN
jgi:hypothetical protein